MCAPEMIQLEYASFSQGSLTQNLGRQGWDLLAPGLCAARNLFPAYDALVCFFPRTVPQKVMIFLKEKGLK